MRKFILVITLTWLLCACSAQEVEPSSAPTSPTETVSVEPATAEAAAEPVETQPATESVPTEAGTPPTTATNPTLPVKRYSNADFGLAFDYPSEWNGPDEYVSGDTLRIAIGSGAIEPYGGGPPGQPAVYLPNAYQVVVQYNRNDHNQVWNETLQMLKGMQDGEMVSDARALTIKVRSLKIGRFEGVEYIGTLSETAQTEPVYTRQVILYDDQSNLITIMGTPNFVVVPAGSDWRGMYRSIDEANLPFFRQIVESLAVEE